MAPPRKHAVFAGIRPSRWPLRIYHVHAPWLGPLGLWPAELGRCKAMGFGQILVSSLFDPGLLNDGRVIADPWHIHPALEHPTAEALPALAVLAKACRDLELDLMLDIDLTRTAHSGWIARNRAHWIHTTSHAAGGIDPRHAGRDRPGVALNWAEEVNAGELEHWWQALLQDYAAAGVAGFRVIEPQGVSRDALRRVVARVAARHARCCFMAWAPGATPQQWSDLSDCGFDGVFSSLPWWDLRAGWFVEEFERLAAVAPVLHPVEAPFGTRLAAHTPANEVEADACRMLQAAALLGAGLMVPMGFEFGVRTPMPAIGGTRGHWQCAKEGARIDLSAQIGSVNTWLNGKERAPLNAALTGLTGPGSDLTVLLRDSYPPKTQPLLIAINPGARAAQLPADAVLPFVPEGRARVSKLTFEGDTESAHGTAETISPEGMLRLEGAEVALFRPQPGAPIVTVERTRTAQQRAIEIALAAPRIAIEAVEPTCDAGQFAVRRLVGEQVRVSADVWMDGHAQLAVAARWHACDEAIWREVRMQPCGNDRYAADLALERMGRYEFTIEAWQDEFGTWLDAIRKNREAGRDLSADIDEGCRLVAQAAVRAPDSGLGSFLEQLQVPLQPLPDPSKDPRLEVLLAPPIEAAMTLTDARPFAVHTGLPYFIEAERVQARFASWYELFPRSQTTSATRHGRFEDVIARLPAIHAMGFDVLYMPPIHPIGLTHRKGPNNRLNASTTDPGSPYAIGSKDGGHDAIHPELGTLADFQRLREAAGQYRMEIALDFAIQCSPDHPWLSEHREWFQFRTDGSVRYAENPPKKYEDIVNVDFYAKNVAKDKKAPAASLWRALRDVVLFWVEQGVRIFRVDNPHTKPLPFWDWLIRDVRSAHPDVIFLAEAFTRPKMMARLAKLGFSQSYTYFTWRSEKTELVSYLTELTQPPLAQYFRPHFFVNTPDINPFFLQRSGRPGFLIRAALAGLLSGLWGMYSGFELCEAQALPGREEYADSEKYEIRPRDWNAPGNIIAEISRLNAIRRSNPALRTHLGLHFYNASNDRILYFGKATPSHDNVVLAAVSLDPYTAQEADIEIPLWEFGLDDGAALEFEDLFDGHHFVWHGKRQHIRIEPHRLPFLIWRIAPAKVH